MTVWSQAYDPLHNTVLSTGIAALPVVVQLGSLALLRIRIHHAALAGLAVALLVALAAVTGLDLLQLSAMVGRQLPFFSLLVPFWLV